MRERIKLEHEPLQEEPSSMQEVVEFLKSKEFDTEHYFYEFEISGEIEPDHIKTLLQLPYEIALTERNGKVIISTGATEETGLEHQYLERRDHSRLSFHTHPIKEGKKTVNTPSFADVYVSDSADKSTPLLLAHGEGVMVYRKPFIDSETRKKTDQDARDIALIYGIKRDVDIFGFGLDKTLKKWRNMSHEEQVSFQRKFAEDTGMIIEEALWEDEEGVKKIMEYINLERIKG